MCWQNYIIYTCDHTKATNIEECPNPRPIQCGPPGLAPSRCLYVNHKCDACRRKSEKEWRIKKQIEAMEREEKKREEARLKKEEDRMLVDEKFKKEVLERRKAEEAKEREMLETMEKEREKEGILKPSERSNAEEGAFVQSQGIMGGLGIFFGM